MDWIIMVPLMVFKFFFFVGKKVIIDEKFLGMGFIGVCFIGALVMIGFGYAGESGLMGELVDNVVMGGFFGFVFGGVGWAMIIVAIGTPWIFGCGVDNDKIASEFMWSANVLRWFIVVGWIIYPLGYLFSPQVDLLSGN
jgi:hypothetical protein